MNSTPAQKKTQNWSGSSTDNVITWPNGSGTPPQSGQLLIVTFKEIAGLNLTGVTDTAGGTWHGVSAVNSGSTEQCGMWYRVVAAGESWGVTPSVTVSFLFGHVPASTALATIYEFDGFLNTPTLDNQGQAVVGSATSDNIAIPALTYQPATELVICTSSWGNTISAETATWDPSGVNTALTLNVTQAVNSSHPSVDAYGTVATTSGANTLAWAWTNARNSVAVAGVFADVGTSTAAGSISFGGSADRLGASAPGSITFTGSADLVSVPAAGSVAFGGAAAPTGDTAAGSISFVGSTASISTATGSISFAGAADQLTTTALGSISFGGSADGSVAGNTTPFMTAVPGIMMPGNALVGAAPFLSVGASGSLGSVTFGGTAQPGASSAGSVTFGAAAQPGVSVLGSLSFDGHADGTGTGNLGGAGSVTFSSSADALSTGATGSFAFTGSGQGTAAFYAVGSVSFSGSAALGSGVSAAGSFSFGGIVAPKFPANGVFSAGSLVSTFTVGTLVS